MHAKRSRSFFMAITRFSNCTECTHMNKSEKTCSEHVHVQARQNRPNSGGGGVAEGQPRFDKGGVANFKTFYALKM